MPPEVDCGAASWISLIIIIITRAGPQGHNIGPVVQKGSPEASQGPRVKADLRPVCISGSDDYISLHLDPSPQQVRHVPSNPPGQVSPGVDYLTSECTSRAKGKNRKFPGQKRDNW
ncbi:hypothetical protein J6590_067057 [Homalodisca vitripennis]|nr:hypothetical protein J6590_067057 [Homalodisca vitripennis]